jgi:hypothetical protein
LCHVDTGGTSGGSTGMRKSYQKPQLRKVGLLKDITASITTVK